MEINENDARGGADCHDSGDHRGGDCRDGSIDVGQDERMREILAVSYTHLTLPTIA